MDLSSVPAAVTSPGVPSVTGTTMQVANPQHCTPGRVGPEPYGTFIHPGQHLYGSRCYLNAGHPPLLDPRGTQLGAAGTREVTMQFSLRCTTEAPRPLSCCSPQCPRRATTACQGDFHFQDPSPIVPPNRPAPVDSRALYDLDGVTQHYTAALMEKLEVDLMDLEAGGLGEVLVPKRP